MNLFSASLYPQLYPADLSHISLKQAQIVVIEKVAKWNHLMSTTSAGHINPQVLGINLIRAKTAAPIGMSRPRTGYGPPSAEPQVIG
jgi:hypothetical protein